MVNYPSIPVLFLAATAVLVAATPAAIAGDLPFRRLHAPALPSQPFDYTPELP